MMTNKPHVHAEVIKAWADGKQIQCADVCINNWVDFTRSGTPAFSTPQLKWRVKPETIRYRVALFKDGCGEYHPGSYRTEQGALGGETRGDFIRWLTDWIEVEV